jgi:hypothetical protein
MPEGQETAGDKALEWYAGQPMARAAVLLIPYAGGSLDALLGTWGSSLAEQRRTAFIEELQASMEKLADDKVDRSWFQTEQWADLVIRAIRASMETRDRQKVRRYAQILAGSSLIGKPDTFDAEAVIGSLASLTPDEVALAGKIYNIATAGHGFVDGTNLPDASANQYDLKRIESAGLISEEVGTMYGYGGGRYHVTSTFRQLMGVIQMVESGGNESGAAATAPTAGE